MTSPEQENHTLPTSSTNSANIFHTGTENTQVFPYVGINIKLNEDMSITIDQQNYRQYNHKTFIERTGFKPSAETNWKQNIIIE